MGSFRRRDRPAVLTSASASAMNFRMMLLCGAILFASCAFAVPVENESADPIVGALHASEQPPMPSTAEMVGILLEKGYQVTAPAVGSDVAEVETNDEFGHGIGHLGGGFTHAPKNAVPARNGRRRR